MKSKIILLGISTTLLIGCVTQKKYDELLADKVTMETELASTQDSLHSTASQLAKLQNRVKQLKADTAGLGKHIRKNRQALSGLKKEYDQLKTQYDNLLNNSGRLTRDLAAQQESLLVMKENLERAGRTNDELEKDLAVREKKVKELEDILAKKDESVQKLKNRITNALLNFKENDLNIEVKNGKVYVSLAEQLLFKSGSTVVDVKGVSALKQLAQALKGQQDINVMVEGHTDNVPLSGKSQYPKDNWDLSVLRATSIIRILTSNGVSSDQVSAAGRGEFAPVDDNKAAEGRQKNRRTEIIITPDLDELFEILEAN